MVFKFWLITAVLVLMAYYFVLRIRSIPFIFFNIIFLPIFCYSIYLKLGSSHYLAHYYSDEMEVLKLKLDKLRPLLFELKKEEIRLRLALEEKPNDNLLQCKLLDVLAIDALQKGDVTLADRLWEEVLKKLDNNQPESIILKNRIMTMRENVKRFKNNQK